MKNIVLALFLMLTSFMSFAQQRFVTLYSECNYYGRASKLYPGRYELNNENVGAFTLSSIRVPYGMKIVIYTGGTPGTGEKTNFMHDVSCLNYDWNDKTASVVVEEVDEASNNGYNYSNNRAPKQPAYHDVVTLFADCNMTGTSVTLSEGWFNYDNFGGVGNDNISSIAIPAGWTVEVFVDKGWNGNRQTFTKSINCLPGVFNNNITSLKITSPSGGNNYQGGNGNSNYNNQNYQQDAQYHNDNATGVNMYANSWYGGNHKKYTAGAYDLRGTDLDQNISSINVDYGFEVVLFDQYDFNGQSYTVKGSELNLNYLHWNDRVRSFVVRKSTQR